ncbi:TIGR03758 family integrating conjugative element protein [Pseudomonas rhodesiae]|uniref:TIGR03758 family integrating conjugative element protein n=1 Tax=Pseudomonas rhodesiae TaxID=76760 RepID=UPI00058CEAE9|nr:TIGR03758 family integrating conjugative element protein [Pseudomonas rhodesiae]
MSVSNEQRTAFLAHGGFTPDASASLLIAVVFAVLLVWGVWALRTAYVGWAEHKLTQRQLLGVAVRFAAMYGVLTYFLLS